MVGRCSVSEGAVEAVSAPNRCLYKKEWAGKAAGRDGDVWRFVDELYEHREIWKQLSSS